MCDTYIERWLSVEPPAATLRTMSRSSPIRSLVRAAIIPNQDRVPAQGTEIGGSIDAKDGSDSSKVLVENTVFVLC